MRHLKFPSLLLVTTLAALISSASADPTGSPYQLTLENLPVDAGPIDLTFQLDSDDLILPGNALVEVAGRSTPVDIDRELVEFFLDAVFPTDLTENANLPGSLLLEGLNWGGQEGRVLADTGFYYFTIDGVPQRMQDTGNLGVTFSNHPLPGEQTTQTVLMDNPGSGFSNSLDFLWSSEQVAPGLSMGDLLTGLDLDPSQINGLHIGFDVSHIVPEPSALALLGMGMVLAIRRRRTARR